MSVISFYSHTLESAVNQYAQTRTDRFHPLVISAAIVRIRMLMPNIRFSDKELASIIAASAVAYGMVVDFDETPVRLTWGAC